MNFTMTPGEVHVTLSRRNLRALLSKLEMEGSARTIWMHDGETVLRVTAEEDGAHYGERTPGPMHPETEAALEAGR